MCRSYKIQALKKVNNIAYKSSPASYVFLILINIFSACFVYVLLNATQYTINSAYGIFNKTHDFKSVVIGITIFSLAKLILKFSDVINILLTNKVNLKLSYTFENSLNSKLSNIKIDYYENNETYVKIHEVRTKSLETMKKFIESTMFYIQAVFKTIIYGYFLIQINILVVAIYLVLVFVFNKLAGNMYNSIMNIWDEIQPYSQKQNYFFSLSGDNITHQEFKFNRLFNFVSSKWDELYEKEYTCRMKIFKKFEITLQLARIVFNIPYICMLIYVAYEIVKGRLEIGFLMLCNELLNGVIDTFEGVQSTLAQNEIDSKFIKSYYEIMNYEDDDKIVMNEKAKNIIFKNVTYKYPQSTTYALENLNFHINSGEKIAIVGHNGSGKTTSTNILMALTNPTSGEIMVDGSSGLKAQCILKSSISCILQDFAQYEMTIRENIEVGNESYKFSEVEIWDLLDKVGLKEVIFNLPKGIDTELGQLKDGIELSKGQWQRLAIARLLAKDDSTVWILDEQTAYLDPISEIEIYNMIYDLAKDKTVLFISHRLGFAKRADRIVVFNDGKIEEEGTHKELLTIDGIYKDMYKNQESWYVA